MIDDSERKYFVVFHELSRTMKEHLSTVSMRVRVQIIQDTIVSKGMDSHSHNASH
jgi:hypothetical protein